ncbi:MAG: acyl--CoA ligase [Verrucomicrobia bacterium]|nr:acyl--CoA ligase [Verrucomicrobiota bacterium]
MKAVQDLDNRITSGQTAFVFASDQELWTWPRLTSEVNRLSSGLIGLGIRPGDRVVLHMANLPEFVVAYLACFQVGAIAAPLNIRLKNAELEPLLQRLRPSLYIGQATPYNQIASVDASVLGATRRFVVDGPVDDRQAQPWSNLLGPIKGAPDRRTVDLNAPAVLLTTSGTTGQPKFVTHTLATLRKSAESFRHWDLDSSQTAAVAFPMSHASGCFTVLACLWSGAPFVLFESFDPDAMLDGIEFHRCSWIAGLPFMYGALLRSQQARARNVDSVRTCLVGGDVCPLQLQEGFSAAFGVPLRSIWASTEAIACLTYGLEPGPISRVANGTEIRLVNDRHVPVATGEIGELILRSANVTIGYWAGPGLIEGAPKDGWFCTGDLMREDGDGNLWFVSRKKFLIIRGGSNISPVEVEQVLTSHPAVQDAAVIGVPDPELGERVAGLIQLRCNDPQSSVLNDIHCYLAERLADYKIPEQLKIVSEIPRNSLGKIDRKALNSLLSN